MRRFLLWLAVTLAAYGAVGVPYHLYLRDHPRRIAVAVDASFEMSGSGEAVRARLRRIAATRYAVFSLHTDKARLHGWQVPLDVGREIVPYGPRDLEGLADDSRHPELREADSVVVLTNSQDTRALRGLPGLVVVDPK
jgi:hypothetical protein